MARAQGARAQMTLAFESSYGTAPPTGDFWQRPFASCNLGSEKNLLAAELLGYGRDPGRRRSSAPPAPLAPPLASTPMSSTRWLDAPKPCDRDRHAGCAVFALKTGCVANQLSCSMQRSGLITAGVNLIAQGEVTGAASVAGALNALPLTRFGAFQRAISREESPLGNVVSAQITDSNNLERIAVIGDDAATSATSGPAGSPSSG